MEKQLEASPIAFRSEPVAENLDDSGIWAFESRHGETFAMGYTRHRFIKLLLITGGAGVIEGDWGRPNCKTGDLVVIPAGLSHRIVDQPRHPISLYGLGIADRLIGCVAGASRLVPTGVFPADALGPLQLTAKMRRLLYSHGQADPLNRLAAVAAALDLVVQVALVRAEPQRAPATVADETEAAEPQRLTESRSRAASLRAGSDGAGGGGEASSHDGERASEDPLLETYLVWLEHNFFESQSLAAAAAACHMSRRYFSTAFRRRTGSSWLEYVNRLRVAHAIELLRATDRKMASIAFQSGFEDVSTFYRAFHRITGKRPGAWRASPSGLGSAQHG